MKGLIAMVAALAVLWLTVPQTFAAQVSEEGGDKGDDIVLLMPHTVESILSVRSALR